jgi:hypothetical protein
MDEFTDRPDPGNMSATLLAARLQSLVEILPRRLAEYYDHHQRCQEASRAPRMAWIGRTTDQSRLYREGGRETGQSTSGPDHFEAQGQP